MGSVLLLALVAGLIAVPGIPVSLLLVRPGQASVITLVAAAFGLGYSVAAGCAFALAAAHAFRLSGYLACWLAASALSWALAARRGSLRDHVRVVAGDISRHRIELLPGAILLGALMIIHLGYLYVLNGPRYIYYLNGMEIANAGGIPSATLEYGQSWLPATDKVCLDAFTGVLALVTRNPAPGPGVLLLTATAGSVVGLWAVGWELGLRWTSVLLPLLCVGNRLILGAMSVTYAEYRAEDFGRAVACCALAVAIVAVRHRSWRLVLAAGLILAAASGSHLISVLVVIIALASVAVAAALAAPGYRARLAPLGAGAAVLAVAALLGAIVRAFAGGTFGLGGAQDQAAYGSLRSGFDPTAYLMRGVFAVRPPGGVGHWYVPPGQVIDTLLTGVARLPGWTTVLLLAALAAAAVLLAARWDLPAVAITGLGIVLGTVGVGLLFAYRYHVYVDATFGLRRMPPYVPVGLFLLALGILEHLLAVLAQHRPRFRLAAALVICCAGAVLLPGTAVSPQLAAAGKQRIELANWVREHTPCDARILVSQRTEGVLTALTARYGVLEGMGPFLRASRIRYVTALMLGARRFFHAPAADETFLTRHEISFVIVARPDELLGYAAPLGRADVSGLRTAPFLRQVFGTASITVYQVTGARRAPRSPLLSGPYLACQRSPIRL